ncbi:hypothetical protein [Prevotella sp. P6B4]|uniref:hypothetical protein n=1 Tax=Prevotella sp. P6B4 TaxID=1410614 RepID=UPI00048D52AF|nr:hypothetical protein [Prevotella sp. P6B4]
MATIYNFSESLSRIDSILSSNIPEKAARAIPSVENINSSSEYLSQATVIHVKYEIVPDMWHPVDKKLNLPVIQSFVSEAICVGGSSSCCKDIMITADYLRLVYDTSLKTELNEALDDAARIRTLAMVVSKLAKQREYPMIKASVGMDYGTVTMLPVNLIDSRYPRFIWTGEVVDRAQQNAGKADDDIVISDVVWKNLTDNNRKLFETDGFSFSTYRGKIVNIAMNNWIAK